MALPRVADSGGEPPDGASDSRRPLDLLPEFPDDDVLPQVSCLPLLVAASALLPLIAGSLFLLMRLLAVLAPGLRP